MSMRAPSQPFTRALQGLLIALILLAPTVQYRVELGFASFALMEPVVLLAAVLLLGRQLLRRGSIYLARDPIIALLVLITLWALLVRPWSANRTGGLSDVRDWLVPTLGYIALVSTVRTGWRRWCAALLAGVVVQSLLGAYQHLTDSARPFVNELSAYKTGFLISPETSQLAFVSFAAGLFNHPNAFAIYLFGGLTLLISWPAAGWRRLVKYALVAFVATCLYWTFAKASLIMVVFALGWYMLQRWVRSGAALVVASGLGLVVVAAALLVVYSLVPDMLLNTMRWRIGLWELGLRLAIERQEILLFGNGMQLFGQQAYYGQPHNLYVYMLLEYGVLGLLWVLAVIWVISLKGWAVRQRGGFALEPRLAGLWVFLIGFFAVGMVESNLLGVESRMVFLIFYACFYGLVREVWPALEQPEQRGVAVYVGAPATHPGSL